MNVHKAFKPYTDLNVKSLGKRQQHILKGFFNKMKDLIAMNYRTTNTFEQEWQKESDSAKNDEARGKYMLKQTDTIYMIYIIITMIAHIAIAWFMSVKQIYKIGGENSTTSPICIVVAISWMIIQVLDILVELNTIKMVGQRQILSRKATFTLYLQQNMLSDFVNIIVADSLMIFTVNTVPSVILTIVSLWTLIRKIIQKKQAFKTYSNDVELLGQFNLIQLLIFALIMGHIFSLLLYISSFIGNFPINWLKKQSIDTQVWYIQYIYALYWAMTTMSTVGYGDISATNPVEIIFSIFVQILGCAIYGYMINIIGMILSDMRKTKQTLQQQVMITKKLGKCFNLSRNLTYQVINYIQNNHKTQQSFSVDDQNKLFGKLNTRLKNQILLETNQRVLKKCVLFLTQFTRNLQNQIALKLIKKIFQPNQMLSDERNNSIFLLDRGEVDVMIQKRHQNKLLFKIIKNLRDTGSRAGLNIFGVIGFFTDNQRNITGKSRAFTVAYQLKKDDFMEVLQDNPFDAQKFFQIRDWINMLPIPEQVQGPLLTNPKQHYCPNKYVVIRKHTYSAKISRGKFNRKTKKNHAFNSYVATQEANQNNSMDQKLQDDSKYSIGGLIQIGRGGTEKAIDIHRSDNRLVSAKNIKRGQVINRIDYQNIKHYDNYFPNSNYGLVLEKLIQKKKRR